MSASTPTAADDATTTSLVRDTTTRAPTSALVVRTAQDSDLDAAGAVAREAFADDGIGDEGYAAVIADARSRARSATVLVALDGEDGPVVGTVTFARAGTPFADVARSGEAEFRMLGVAADGRGRGVGTALVRACTRLARAAGADRLVLSVHEDAGNARRLYERLGFVREPDRDWDPVPGAHLLLYSLGLSGSPDLGNSPDLGDSPDPGGSPDLRAPAP